MSGMLGRLGIFALVLFGCLSAGAQQRPEVVVAVVVDGPPERLEPQRSLFIEELVVLTEREFDVEIQLFPGDWSRESIEAVIGEAYADPEVDLVLLAGYIANQLAARMESYPKPTFLPLVLDTTPLLRKASDQGVSGVPNLNYLTAYADFVQSLDALARLVPYRNLVVLFDTSLAASIPDLRESAIDVATARGIRIIEVEHDGVDHDLMSRIPAATDAVFVSALPRMPQVEFEALVDAINSAGLPSYSFVGVQDVESGLLVTNSEPRDVDRLARLNALNMQAVMLGEPPEDQPTRSPAQERLTINMATARQLGLSPSFEVMDGAVLLNFEEDAAGPKYGLVSIARMALESNQDLQAESYGVQANLEEIARARSSLLPQVDAQLSHTSRKNSPSVSAGLFAERSNDAAVSVTQLIYSDSATANLKIQQELQRTRMASFREFQLDVIRAATTAYYTVQNAKSQLEVQANNLRISRANLELAENRVKLGTSSSADVYRWQAEVARAEILVVTARATLNQSWETLNRILHKPQGARFGLKDATFDEPFVLSRGEFDKLVASPADYARFSRYYINRALRQSPELEQFDAQIVAKRRELKNRRRAYWLPDFTLGGQYADNLNQSGAGAGMFAGQGLSDWSVGVQATLPIFSGGLKRANLSKSGYELRQLESLRISTLERIEEEIRNQLHAATAAYARIELSNAAADASRKNFELVSDAYARGNVSVIELLDAQDTSLTASAAAVESQYEFLITIMSVQRAIGGYDFLLTQEQRDALAEEMRRAMTGASE